MKKKKKLFLKYVNNPIIFSYKINYLIEFNNLYLFYMNKYTF